MVIVAETRTALARDGQPLASTLFRPSEGPPERLIVVGCAMGVRRGFYEPYARYLARQGCAALTFDYRGIGGSLEGSVAGLTATMRDWAENDFAAIIDLLSAEFPGKKLQIVGHSIGGQFTGLLDNHDRVAAICTVAAQHGYWRLYPIRQAMTLAATWHLIVPVLTRSLSYFPGRRFGFTDDIPCGVALEWARWARHRDYMVNDEGVPLRRGFLGYRGPILAYSFDDDDRAPLSCVRALHALFENATVEHRHVISAALGSKGGVGHTGFFRSTFKHTLWRESLQWLREH